MGLRLFPAEAMAADPKATSVPKAASVPKACSVLPTLLLCIYANANIDFVAEIKLPMFAVNHVFSAI